MADPIQYSGVSYDTSYYKTPDETMYDYMQRLAAQRAQGVLGGGGMLDTPAEEITSAPLGQVQQNCPAGYELRNGACVRVGGDDSDELPQIQFSNEERIKGIRHLLENPAQRMLLQSVVPFGGILFREGALEGALRNDQNEATGSQGFLDYLRGKDGDVVLGDRGAGTGSLVTGQETDITRDMFPEIFDPMNFTSQMGVVNQATTFPATMPQLPTLAQEAQLQRTMGMMDTLNQLNSGSVSGGDSGYYSDSSGSYTGGADYGGWTGVTADDSGNDWYSFDGDDTY